MAGLVHKLHSSLARPTGTAASAGAQPNSTASSSSSSSAAPAAPLPAFLAVPLQSEAAWHAIAGSLQEREGRRQELGAPTCTVDRFGRPKILIGSEGGKEGPFSTREGLSQQNQGKNRYCNIIAYDRTRVLTAGDADYLNASLVREPELGLDPALLPRRWWIAAQAPTPSCVHSFLLSLLAPATSAAHSNAGAAQLPLVALLLQLTPLTEKGHRKAHPYFPKEVGATQVYPPQEEDRQKKAVWVRLDGKEGTSSYRKSSLTIGEEGDSTGRRVTHVEYLGWSDHGVPADPAELLTFLTAMDKLNTQLSAASSASSQPAPVLVHCSAGVGRTGTYITLASLLPLVALYKPPTPPALGPLAPPAASHPLGAYPHGQVKGVERDFVGLTVDGLREQRTTMVQTMSQLRWCFEALAVAWREDLLG